MMLSLIFSVSLLVFSTVASPVRWGMAHRSGPGAPADPGGAYGVYRPNHRRTDPPGAGADSPAVTIRLLQTYARLALQLRNDEQRKAILDQIEAARQSMLRIPSVGLHQTALDAAYQLARQRLTIV
jgi:hypothetical protein